MNPMNYGDMTIGGHLRERNSYYSRVVVAAMRVAVYLYSNGVRNFLMRVLIDKYFKLDASEVLNTYILHIFQYL